MRSFYKIFATSIVLLVFLGILPLNSAYVGASPGEIKITTPFPRIKVNPGQNIQLSINVNNLGSEYETLSLEVSEPENWEVTLKSGGYLIEMVLLAPGENQSAQLTITPPLSATAGSYTTEIKALDGAGNVKDSLDIIVDIAEISPLGITLSTTNPSIEGPAGKTFQFTASVVNETGQETDIALDSVLPTGWSLTFMPIYESTLIRAVHMEEGENIITDNSYSCRRC